MNYKDNMGREIKNILEEETKDIKLSSNTIDKIMESRKTTIREKIRNFLNQEIQIPLAPAIIGFILVLGISIFPKDFPTNKKLEIIELNGAEIIVRSEKEVNIR